MAADYYSDSPGDYGMPNTSNGGPTGIPDPNNPGYDTAGYPLPGERTGPAVPRTGALGPQGPGQPPPTAPGPPPGGLIDLFTGPAPAYTPGSVGPAPVFTPPPYTPPPAFRDPTLEEAQNEPGYQAAVKEGEGQVAASAAARGVLNSGGTLKDIYAYGANAATQNYQNVDNRARQTYLTNYQTQYTDPYAFAYRSAADAFAPRMAQYAAENGMALANTQGANTFDFNNWLQQYNIFRNRQIDTLDANAKTNG